MEKEQTKMVLQHQANHLEKNKSVPALTLWARASQISPRILLTGERVDCFPGVSKGLAKSPKFPSSLTVLTWFFPTLYLPICFSIKMARFFSQHLQGKVTL